VAGVFPSDSHGDGISDDEDVEGIQQAIDGLPAVAFKSGDRGLANAMHSILDDIEALIASGNKATAIKKLQNLRTHVDGCGSKADTNDWIVSACVEAVVEEHLPHAVE
jgi:hypothetical protein